MQHLNFLRILNKPMKLFETIKRLWEISKYIFRFVRMKNAILFWESKNWNIIMIKINWITYTYDVRVKKFEKFKLAWWKGKIVYPKIKYKTTSNNTESNRNE